MAAKKKPVEKWSLADLGLDASQVGLEAAWTRVAAFDARPPRAPGRDRPDEGEGGSKLASSCPSTSSSDQPQAKERQLHG